MISIMWSIVTMLFTIFLIILLSVAILMCIIAIIYFMDIVITAVKEEVKRKDKGK